MSAGVFAAVLLAAFLHAFWNALVKTGEDKVAAMLLLSAGNAAVAAVFVAFKPLPPAELWPWLLASGLIHTAYQVCLAMAYERGDLSRVYPISRGTAPLLVLAAGAFVLPDRLMPTEIAGIALLGLGIVSMARGIGRDGERTALLPFALGAAICTAGYSIVDGSGARLLGDGPTYVAWSLLVGLVFFVPVALLLRGPGVLRARPAALLRGGLGGAASFTAYAIAVWAMTQAPIALVSALRESSILFAMLIGWVLVGEPMSRHKLASGAVILAGVVLTRL
ncbi:DMT family transporter [Profundibacterium mesophilum]|uniref:Membrane protein n=1 Tax=Profundibacterium mesophilum KAUST100406-0324 TaxID=1037889 RepID=A0A921NU02_9RHOB|nr:DMT family transporter [Profundibacterium mesophilum]KAF0676609.1 putative membrane protein [Profundibacterium mesophilum KAUST100406-0324]